MTAAVTTTDFALKLLENPSDEQARLAIAREHVANGELHKGLDLLEQGAALNPASLELRLAIGSTLYELGEHRAALERFAGVISTNRSNSWGYIWASRCLLKLEGMTSWEAQLERGVQHCSSPSNYTAIYNEYSRTLTETYSMDVTKAKVVSGEPIPNAAVVGMVKDETDIISQFLAHNYRIGLRNFLLLDNNSTDSTRAQILEFRDSHDDVNLVVVDDPVTGYYQDSKMTGGCQFAKTYFSGLGHQIDWLFPLDADEFIAFTSADTSLKSILDKMSADGAKILMYYLCDATALDLDVTFDRTMDPFETFPVVMPFAKSAIPKVAYWPTQNAWLHMGNHFVNDVASRLHDVQPAARYGVFLMHFGLRGKEHAKRKYVNGGIAYSQTVGRDRAGARWRKHYRNYQRWGELYFDRMYRDYAVKVARLAGVEEQMTGGASLTKASPK